MSISPPVVYDRAAAITTSNTANFDAEQRCCDAIHVGGAGTVTVVWPDDTTTQFTCVAGQILPVRVKRVNATGTAATALVAMYNQ